MSDYNRAEERKILDRLSERLDEDQRPYYFCMTTGEKHLDDNSDIVITWTNLDREEQYSTLIDMIKKDSKML